MLFSPRKLAGWLLICATCQTLAQAAPPVTPKVKPFPLADVRLTDGPFKVAQDKDLEYLLKLEPDRLLSGMREAAHLPPKGARYGGWDKSGSGLVGHYLSACAQMAAATGDSKIRERVDYVVAQMAECQQARPDGGLFANRWEGDKWFADLAKGTAGFGDVLPWYVLHKAMAGLRDAYTEAGNVQAREVLIKLCDFCVQVTAKLTDDQWKTLTSKEYGAPNEILADVYAWTGNAKYLELAQRFTKHDVADALARGDGSVLINKHANTQIPLFVGYERIHEVGGEGNWHLTAQKFWDEVIARQTFAFGGNSIWEKFINPAEYETKLLDTCGPETCNTYNLLKLTQQLYSLDPQMRYVDYAERALYNQILPSESTRTPDGGFAYYTPTRPGHYKVYSRPFDAMWCCVGSGMENQARYGGFIYASATKRLFINLFIPSELQWKDEGTSVRQFTTFPDVANSVLAFTVAQTHAFTVSVRCPSWTTPGAMRLEVNGQAVLAVARPGGYVDVTRIWQTGDRLRVVLPAAIRAEWTPGGKFVAFSYGPILLATPLGRTGLEEKDFFAGGNLPFEQLGRKTLDPKDFPVAFGARNLLAASLQRDQQAGGLRFLLGAGAGKASTPLVPFYTVGLQRYSVYFPYSEQSK